MSAPTRFTSGLTQAAKFQPLGNMGSPDPFFYAEFYDDFIPYVSSYYTVTAAGGSVAASATGTNGRILFTTGATAGNFAEIQTTDSNFQYVAGKKLFFLTRLQVASVSTAQFIAGLISTNVTPFSAVADGIYFTMAAGSSNLVLNAVTGSTVIGTTTITGAISANTDIDLGFFVDSQGNIRAFVGSNLEGVARQDYATLGPNHSILAANMTGALTTALLQPTLAISNGTTAAAITGLSDFLLGASER